MIITTRLGVHMKLTIFTFLFATILVLPAFAQSVEVGATLDTSASPNKSAYASYLHPIAGGFKSFSTVSMWRVGANQIAHSLVTGIERPMYTQGPFTLALHAQVGEAQSLNAFSGNFNGGGSLVIAPKMFKSVSIVISGSATDTPATGAWFPKVSGGLRYAIAPQQ